MGRACLSRDYFISFGCFCLPSRARPVPSYTQQNPTINEAHPVPTVWGVPRGDPCISESLYWTVFTSSLSSSVAPAGTCLAFSLLLLLPAGSLRKGLLQYSSRGLSVSRNSWAATASESGSPLVPIYGSPVLDSRGPCSDMAHIASCMSDVDVDRLSIGSYIARSVSPLPVVEEVSAFPYIETSCPPS